MNENTGFAAFALYNALKLHFSSKSYDYIKYNGKTNVSKQTFLLRKDKYSFYKLSRKYSLPELKQFYIANFLVEKNQWVGDMTGPAGEDNFKKWQKRTQSLTYLFQNEVDYLFNKYKPCEMMKVEDGYPKLLQELMQDNISIETVLIMNNLLGFIEKWNSKIEDDIVWPEYELRIRKYKPFLEYNESKCKSILKEKVKESAEA
jgi:hypothetical protein